ncbi:Hypothetical_protein [Hexamita inflata]|uniref:Hypothetical_protein n=1 Tax=Hexamita inflata TaxID=28002 RepID=A0ABP1JFZ3_9EUKA
MCYSVRSNSACVKLFQSTIQLDKFQLSFSIDAFNKLQLFQAEVYNFVMFPNKAEFNLVQFSKIRVSRTDILTSSQCNIIDLFPVMCYSVRSNSACVKLFQSTIQLDKFQLSFSIDAFNKLQLFQAEVYNSVMFPNKAEFNLVQFSKIRVSRTDILTSSQCNIIDLFPVMCYSVRSNSACVKLFQSTIQLDKFQLSFSIDAFNKLQLFQAEVYNFVMFPNKAEFNLVQFSKIRVSRTDILTSSQCNIIDLFPVMCYSVRSNSACVKLFQSTIQLDKFQLSFSIDAFNKLQLFQAEVYNSVMFPNKAEFNLVQFSKIRVSRTDILTSSQCNIIDLFPVMCYSVRSNSACVKLFQSTIQLDKFQLSFSIDAFNKLQLFQAEVYNSVMFPNKDVSYLVKLIQIVPFNKYPSLHTHYEPLKIKLSVQIQELFD